VGRSPQELAPDLTTWKFALIDIELLTFWIAHQGAAHPTVRPTLSKAGNTSIDGQITLMEIFIDLFGKDRIKSLTDRREFVGKQGDLRSSGCRLEAVINFKRVPPQRSLTSR
jgi:hypothetical protein